MEHTDFIATELLGELKAENKRKDSVIHSLQKIIVCTISIASVLILSTICGFLIYLNQYDFTSTIDATGVYALVDSEGNVIANDLMPEDITTIMEVLNGESKGHEVED